MKMKRVWLALVVVALLFTSYFATAQSTITIGYAVMGMDHPLFQAMMAGVKEAAASLGVNLVMVDAQWQVDRQNAQLEDFIAKKVSVVLVNPVTATETVPTLEKVRAAGIPIVAIDTRPVGFEPDAYIAMDMYQGGYIAGKYIGEKLKGEGRYATIWAAGNEQAAQRVRGLKAGLQEACEMTGYPNHFVEEGEYSGITGPIRETSRKIAATLLTKYPRGQLAFIFGQTDEFAIGAYLATQAANRPDVLIVGMDNNSDMRRMLAEGKNLISTTAHLPKEVGKAAVDTAMKILKHQPYLKEVLLSFQLDTQDSVKYDPGWGGQYKPSFSSYLWPEQLGALGTK